MRHVSKQATWSAICSGLVGTLMLTSGGHAQQCQTKTLSNDPDPFDNHGLSVSVEGSYFVTGAPGDSANAGAAYVFERNLGGAGNWGQGAKLTGMSTPTADGFGTDVSISNNLTFVGSPYENSSGALYIFQRVSGTSNWNQLKHIPAPVGLVNDAFGFSIEAAASRVLVGSSESGPGPEPGHAYIYEQNNGGFNQWGLQATLQAVPPVPDEAFGWGVGLDTNTAVVGAIGNDSLTINAGAAYVFDRNQGGSNNWGQVTQLLPSVPFPNGFFGMKCSVSGDYAFVAAPGENFGQGAVYVFWRFQGGINNWGQLTRITAPTVTPVGAFGSGVFVRGNRALIGEESGPLGGSVYMLEQNWGGPNNWGIVKRVNADNFGPADEFGADVHMSSTDGVVGAPRTPLGASTFVGAGYVLDTAQCLTAMPYGFCHTDAPCGNTDPNGGCANSSGAGARIAASGSSSVSADDLVLTTTQVPTNTVGLFFMGNQMSRIGLGDGLRVASGTIRRLYPATSSGSVNPQFVKGPGIAATQPDIQPGTTWNFQTWFRDTSGPCGAGTNLSNGMSVTFVP